MATWNSDNIILTLKGLEVLSKVQSGIGKITVSRIVTGGGFVSPSQLFQQTDVTDEKQEMIIQNVDTDSNGSSIEVSISNDSLTEEYYLYQIGIYITHQDYTEEVLYLLAQCNTSDPDLIPLPSITPISLNYSLYMEHSDTENVTILVDPSGSVSIPVFNEFKSNVTRLLPITFLASNWESVEGEEGAYTQRIDNDELKETDNPYLVKLFDETLNKEGIKAYEKEYSIINSGIGTTYNGYIIYKIFDLPTTDIVAGLKGV